MRTHIQKVHLNEVADGIDIDRERVDWRSSIGKLGGGSVGRGLWELGRGVLLRTVFLGEPKIYDVIVRPALGSHMFRFEGGLVVEFPVRPPAVESLRVQSRAIHHNIL
jgi:hypothetical protein